MSKYLAAALLLLIAACKTLPEPGFPSYPAHPGVDTWEYPGNEALRTWAKQAPYEWTGYYLTSPCHKEASWMGTRGAIERLGWGTAVLYVGQQTFEDDPSGTPTSGPVVCSRSLLTPEQGRLDALDAMTKSAGEGFPAGSTIFLDIERMSAIPPEMFAYYRAWTETVLASGRYVPGTYAHRQNAEALYAHARASFLTAGSRAVPPFWVAGSGNFALDAVPSASGAAFATVWQGVHDVRRTFGGVSLDVDENVAARPSPSAPMP